MLMTANVIQCNDIIEKRHESKTGKNFIKKEYEKSPKFDWMSNEKNGEMKEYVRDCGMECEILI